MHLKSILRSEFSRLEVHPNERHDKGVKLIEGFAGAPTPCRSKSAAASQGGSEIILHELNRGRQLIARACARLMPTGLDDSHGKRRSTDDHRRASTFIHPVSSSKCVCKGSESEMDGILTASRNHGGAGHKLFSTTQACLSLSLGGRK